MVRRDVRRPGHHALDHHAARMPAALQSLRNVPLSAILKANLFAVGWGIANVLCGLCFVRIGMALTGAILAGLGVSVGAIVPMIFKGSGLFKNAAELTSTAGLAVCLAVALMLTGVAFASLAGFGRDREFKKISDDAGGFLTGLIMSLIAGVLSSGMAFVFVYSQDPIVANLSVVQPGHRDFHPGGRAQSAVGQVCRGGRWADFLGRIWGKSPWVGSVPGKLVNDSRSTSETCCGNPMLASWCRPEVSRRRLAYLQSAC